MNEAQVIARTIMSQIGARRLMALGAKDYVALSSGLKFSASLFGRKNCGVTITLDKGTDTYVVALYNRGFKKKLTEFNDIYAEHVGRDVEDLVEGFFRS